jgi:hypothetical protein
MNRSLYLVMAGLFLMSCVSAPTPSVAAEPNIVIMGEDWDQDTIPRKSQVFERVLSALKGEMGREGFKVYDETFVTPNHKQGRIRRSDEELMTVLRGITHPPMDVAVIFKIYPRIERMNITTQVNALITGRLLNVSSGRELDNFEVTLPQAQSAPKDCNRECLIEVVGRYTKILAQDLGAILVTKLRRHAKTVSENVAAFVGTRGSTNLSRAFVLTFNGFKSKDQSVIEGYLKAFKGYEHHRPVLTGIRHAEYWYEATIDQARLEANLRKMTEVMGVQARVACAREKCTIEKY